MTQPRPPLDTALLSLLQWLWDTDPLADPALDRRARELLADTLGCAIAGIAEPEVASLARHLAAGDPGPLGFPGLQSRMTAAGLAMTVAAGSCWHEACEGLPAAHGRPGLHVIPAILGPSLAAGRPLGDVLRALVVGYEIGGRMGMVCRIRPGMHVDGTWGSFGAAVAACHLAGLSPAVALGAMNHAACHLPFSLYRPIAAGSTARNAFVGHGAVHGMTSMAASAAGLAGPPGSIAEMARLALGLGPDTLPAMPLPGTWLIRDGYLKLYPAVKHVHYGAALAEQFHAEQGSPPIQAITLRVYAEALTYVGNRAPTTAIQAQFSASYGAAWSLVHGRMTPSAYTPSSLTDPAVQRLEQIITLEDDTALTQAGRRGGTLCVEWPGGSWQRSIDGVPGDAETPMSRADITEKFLAYTGPVIGVPLARQILRDLLDEPLQAPLRLAM
jgi:2-methylcitrate dehydratase PrpD